MYGLLVGDIHLLYTTPLFRKDDIVVTQRYKVQQSLDIYKKYSCGFYCQPGDFFDTPMISDIIKEQYIRLFKSSNVILHGVEGQHDKYMRSEQSPLKVLDAAGVYKLLNTTPVILNDENEKIIELYGIGFGEEFFPMPPKNEANVCRILVIHYSAGIEDIYPGAPYTNDLQKLMKYGESNSIDLILVGDYHWPFIAEYRNGLVVNVGCLTRCSRAKKNLELIPSVYVYDTISKTIFEKIALDVAPPEDIFRFEDEVPVSENIDLKRFIRAMQRSGENSVSFLNNLNAVLKQGVDDSTKDIIFKAIQEVGYEEKV